MATEITKYELDLKSPLATQIPLRVQPGVSLASTATADILFVLKHDLERLPLGTPLPWFGIFNEKGALLLRTNYVAGVTNWPIENTSVGRIGFQVSGSNSAFGVINSKNPVRLEWRLIGVFDSSVSREITAAKGDFIYAPSGEEVSGGDPADNLGDCCDQLGLEIQYELDNQYYYTEYTWDPITADLLSKQHWDSVGKNDHLFTITYQWSPAGLLTRKTITRHRDGAILRLDYTWAPQDGTPTSETLLSIQRTALAGV